MTEAQQASDKERVLVIVEDEPDMRAMIRAILTVDPRIEVVGEAATAAEAIEAVKANQPGLIVLDHSIEGDVMGLDAASALKDACDDCKILLFTAFDLRQEAEATPAVDEYLSKSDVGELRPTVLRLLGLD